MFKIICFYYNYHLYLSMGYTYYKIGDVLKCNKTFNIPNELFYKKDFKYEIYNIHLNDTFELIYTGFDEIKHPILALTRNEVDRYFDIVYD